MIFYLTLLKKIILLLTHSKQYGHKYNKVEAHLHKCNTESKNMILQGILKKYNFLEKQKVFCFSHYSREKIAYNQNSILGTLLRKSWKVFWGFAFNVLIFTFPG